MRIEKATIEALGINLAIYRTMAAPDHIVISPIGKKLDVSVESNSTVCFMLDPGNAFRLKVSDVADDTVVVSRLNRRFRLKFSSSSKLTACRVYHDGYNENRFVEVVFDESLEKEVSLYVHGGAESTEYETVLEAFIRKLVK